MSGAARRLAVRAVSTVAAGSGLLRLLRARRRREGPRLFILEYHDVSADGVEREGTISAERFARHLRFLKTRYPLLTLEDAARRLARPGGLDRDAAVVTFDDGHAGTYDGAWPVLREADAPATVFLTTGFLDGAELWTDFARRALAAARDAGLASAAEDALRTELGGWPVAVEPAMRRLKRLPAARRETLLATLRDAGLPVAPAARAMSWDQAREIAAGGVELGAHTISHPILSTLDPAAQEAEIAGSRARIAEKTRTRPATFAYPNGSARDFDDHTVAILERLGFAAACTTIRGANRPGDPPYTLRRLGVGADPLAVLEARLAGLFDDALRRRLGR